MQEYLRRNLVVCRAYGANASIKMAIDRLDQHKNPPKWLLAQLDAAKQRIEDLPAELAKWRNTAPDNPNGRVPAQEPQETE